MNYLTTLFIMVLIACNTFSQTGITRLDSIVDYSFKLSDNQFYKYHKTEYIYNSKNQNIETNIYKTDSTKTKWLNQYKYHHIFNVDGSLQKSFYYRWGTDGSLSCYKTQEFFYANGLDTLVQVFHNTSQIHPYDSFKIRKFYNGDQDTLHLKFGYDTTTKEWVLISTVRNEFDIDGNCIISTSIGRMYVTAPENQKIEYKYVNGKRTEALKLKRDANTSEWMNYGKELITYNDSNDIITFKELHWNEQSMQWDSSMKYETEYNLNYSQADFITPVNNLLVDIYTLHHPPILNKKHINFSGDWKNFSKSQFYYYEDNVTNITQSESENDFIFYPQPAKNYLNIKTKVSSCFNYTIIDMRGIIVMDGEIVTPTRININLLNSGFYTLLLIGEKGTFSRLICIE